MANFIFGQDFGKCNLFRKPVKFEDVSNSLCGRNVKFVATIVFGGRDYVPDLEAVWSPTFTRIRVFVDYIFFARWSQWTVLEIIVAVEAGVG